MVDNDEKLDIVNKIVEDDGTIEDLEKDYPNEIKNLKKQNLIIWEKTILKF